MLSRVFFTSILPKTVKYIPNAKTTSVTIKRIQEITFLIRSPPFGPNYTTRAAGCQGSRDGDPCPVIGNLKARSFKLLFIIFPLLLRCATRIRRAIGARHPSLRPTGGAIHLAGRARAKRRHRAAHTAPDTRIAGFVHIHFREKIIFNPSACPATREAGAATYSTAQSTRCQSVATAQEAGALLFAVTVAANNDALVVTRFAVVDAEDVKGVKAVDTGGEDKHQRKNRCQQDKRGYYFFHIFTAFLGVIIAQADIFCNIE